MITTALVHVPAADPSPAAVELTALHDVAALLADAHAYLTIAAGIDAHATPASYRLDLDALDTLLDSVRGMIETREDDQP